VPNTSAACVGAAVASGFAFHHAQPEYVLLTRWLPLDQPSPLPKYAFTQIGVGVVVVNGTGQVLMVQEKVSPVPQYQGCWKLPGGLADPGEDFADTVLREVDEETGVKAELAGLSSLRHTHGFRFNQGDLYVVVKLRALSEVITICPHELLGAQWMEASEIESLVVEPKPGVLLDGKVSLQQWKIIEHALYGPVIRGEKTIGHKVAMLYTAANEATNGESKRQRSS